MLPGFGLWFVAIVLGGVKGLLVGFVGFALLILYILVLSVMMSAVQGIFNARLSAPTRNQSLPGGPTAAPSRLRPEHSAQPAPTSSSDTSPSVPAQTT